MAKKKAKKKAAAPRARTAAPRPTRISVPKTYKMFVNGAFIRSEGGKVLDQHDRKGSFMAHYARGTRKDLRDAVGAARKAQAGWAGRSAFNRSQILYRLAEMVEDRRAVFVERLTEILGDKPADASAEVDVAVDRIYWYAGWTDKFSQVLGGVNPVATPFFNFTVPDPTGVVVIAPSRRSPFLGLVSAICPVILSGNTCVVIVENDAPVIACDLTEAIATSDFPAGVVNVLTGHRSEMIAAAASHMDVNAMAYFGGDDEERAKVRELASENVKRAKVFEDPTRRRWMDDSSQSLYWIEPFVEWKTAWHPIGT